MKTSLPASAIQAIATMHKARWDGGAAFFRKFEVYAEPGAFKNILLRVIFLINVFFVLSTGKIYGQEIINYAVHANIIYRFTKYIDWPADKKDGDFFIGVTGDGPLYDALRKSIAGKMVGDQKIVIQKFSSSANSFTCHILFITEEKSGSIKRIVAQTAGAPLLLVSESEGMASKGACINFVVVADRLKLEINKNNIGQRDLDIASELLQLGKIVK